MYLNSIYFHTMTWTAVVMINFPNRSHVLAGVSGWSELEGRGERQQARPFIKKVRKCWLDILSTMTFFHHYTQSPDSVHPFPRISYPISRSHYFSHHQNGAENYQNLETSTVQGETDFEMAVSWLIDWVYLECHRTDKLIDWLIDWYCQHKSIVSYGLIGWLNELEPCVWSNNLLIDWLIDWLMYSTCARGDTGCTLVIHICWIHFAQHRYNVISSIVGYIHWLFLLCFECSRYIWSFYFSLHTLTMIGIIVQPQVEWQFLFMCLNFVISVMLFSQILGNVAFSNQHFILFCLYFIF